MNYKELLEQITTTLWDDLSYTGLDFDSRKDCAKEIISLISKNLINDFLYDLRDKFKDKVNVVFEGVLEGVIIHAGEIEKLIKKYEDEFKNVEKL